MMSSVAVPTLSDRSDIRVALCSRTGAISPSDNFKSLTRSRILLYQAHGEIARAQQASYAPSMWPSRAPVNGSDTTASPASVASAGSGQQQQQQQQPFFFGGSSNGSAGMVASTSSGQFQPQSQLQSSQQQQIVPPKQAGTSLTGATRSRRKWTAEERREHSVVEKKRREEFNSNLMVSLYRELPAIQVVAELGHSMYRT